MHQLGSQVRGQGRAVGQRALVTLIALERAAAARARPVDLPAGVLGVRPLAGGALAGGDVVDGRVQLAPGRRIGHRVDLGQAGVPLGLDLNGRLVIALIALQERIALQLGLDEGVELDVRQLQQLDGLLQLRGDDEALALPEL